MPQHETVDSVPSKRLRRIFNRKHWRRWLLGLVTFAAVAYVAVPWLYINVFSEPAPPPLSFEQLDKDRASASTTDTSSATPGPSSTLLNASRSAPRSALSQAANGIWTVTKPSSAGYRVQESIAGQAKTAVGRTSTVDGSFTIVDGRVKAAEVNVDLSSMVSDEAQRDEQFRERIMDTNQFPVATFTLTEPFELTSGASDRAVDAVKVQGTLLLRGTEKPATFTVSAKLTGDSIAIVASTEVTFSDYLIPNPSIGPVSTDDHGTIEVALTAKQ
jgi:polyisoprenoid-binding protein YceI